VVRGEANPIITIGTGLIYEDQQTNPFYTFTWTTTGFPSSVTVCNEDVIEPLQVDDYVLVDSISRIRETTKTYPDGVSAYYYRSAIFDGGTVYVDSFRRSREGGTISVQAVLDTGSTPDCPLDDTGTISVIRTFPVPSHLAEGVTAPVEETAVIDKQGLTENVSFTLTYSNGQILTRSWQRQVQSPTSCSAWETASSPSSLVTQVTGPLYLGGDLDFTVTHDVLGLSLTGTQTQTDGSYTEFEVDRYQNAEVSSLQAKQYQADHTLTAEMAVKLRGDSQGQGQITVFAGGNTQAIIPHFTCNGEDFWSSNDDPSDRHELGSGKLKKANADI
jgi:hypothetical protein